MSKYGRDVNALSSPMSYEDVESGTANRHKARLRSIGHFFKDNLIIVSLLVSIVLAIIIGSLMRILHEDPYTKREVMYASFIGSLFLRLLKCVTISLFTSCVILTLGELDMKTSGKLGLSLLGYFYATSLCAAAIALFFVLVMRPGSYHITAESMEPVKKSVPVDNLLDLFRNMVPPNIVEACVFMYKTTLQVPENSTQDHEIPLTEWEFVIEPSEAETNYLGLITLSIVIGLYLSYMGESVRILLVFAEAVNDITINIIFWLIYISPGAIFCLILGETMAITNLNQTLQSLAWYIGTFLMAQISVALIFHPLIYVCFVRRSPIRFMRNMIQAIAAAFATNSSIASIPITLKCLEEKNMLNEFIVRFVVTLGATLNTNCPAVYEIIGVLFLAQKRDITLNVEQYIAVVAVVTLASTGAAGIPQSSIISIMVLLGIVGVPDEDIGILMTVDWLLDRISSACNVLIDSLACGIFAHTSGDRDRNIILLESVSVTNKMQGNVRKRSNLYLQH